VLLSLNRLISRLPDWHWLNQLLQGVRFVQVHGRWPRHLAQCQDLNDYWLLFKSSHHSAAFSYFVDKDLVKDFVTLVLGSDLVIPSLLVTDDLAELAAFSSSQPYIVKPTHSSRDVLLKPMGGRLTPAELQGCARWLKVPLYRRTREYQYKHLKPKFIVEPQLTLAGAPPEDFKFMVVNGQVAYVSWIRSKLGTEKIQIYDAQWQRIPIRFNDFETLNDPNDYPKPAGFGAMLNIAETLGRLFPVVRVDLYQTDQGIKFSELTLTPSNACQKIEPASFFEQLWQQIPPTWPRRIL
jgi:hypothetical protein